MKRKYDYLIYYTIATGALRAEGNICLYRTCPINSPEEVESARAFIAENTSGGAKDLLAAGGKIIIANIMPLK